MEQWFQDYSFVILAGWKFGNDKTVISRLRPVHFTVVECSGLSFQEPTNRGEFSSSSVGF